MKFLAWYNTYMKILAIESSCDETACAIVEKSTEDQLVKVVAAETATSLQKHKVTKGIVPEVAAREQLKVILPVIQATMASEDRDQLDAIAVTTGPGLIGSLLVGVETARALAMAWDLPVIPVNHLLAHPYANFVTSDDNRQTPEFPILSWVISGGHTQLYFMPNHDRVIKLGGTLDDAAGECFDKCARVLGFDYPGGPEIEKLAGEYQAEPHQQKLPRPLIHDKALNLSFSGLKTAFARLATEVELDQNPQLRPWLADELQQAIVDVIIAKTKLALQQYPQVKTLMVSGGVAANSHLRKKLSQLVNEQGQNRLKLFISPLSLATDNAVMVGAYAAFHPQLKTEWQQISVKL